MEQPNKATHAPFKKPAPPPPTNVKNKPLVKVNDRSNGNIPAKPVETVKEKAVEADASQFDALAVSSGKLSHPTSDRPKMPGKRPPTNQNHSAEEIDEKSIQQDTKTEEREEQPKAKASLREKDTQLPAPLPAPVPVPLPAPAQSQAPSPAQSKTPSPAPAQSPAPSPAPSQSKAPSPAPAQSPVPSPASSQSKAPSSAPAQSKAPSPAPAQSPAPSAAPSQSHAPSNAQAQSPAPSSSSPPRGTMAVSPNQPQTKKTQAAKTSPIAVVTEAKKAADVDSEHKQTVTELKSDIQSLKVVMEMIKAQYERDMLSMKAELKQERAERLALQVEMDKLKKLVAL